MVAYNVEYSYDVEEYDDVVVNADDTEQAEMFAKEYIQETYPEAKNIVIDTVKEV